MSFQKKHSGLTRQTARKLSSGESESLDFKLKPVGLSVDDLVAFANTDSGGEIILGVEEKKNGDGSQFGLPVGCDLSDDVVLQLLNKAISAIPPISIKLFAENIDSAAIIRVVIPPSGARPHCTPKGTYLRRDGSRNRPLQPPELLRIFLESESRAFAERFENTAEAITAQLGNLQRSLTSSVDDMASQLGWVDSQLGDTENAMQNAAAYSKLAHEEAQDLSSRMRAIFKQDKRDDPVYEKVRNTYLLKTIEQLRNDPSLVEAVKSQKGGIQMSVEGKAALELSKDDLQKIFEEAFLEVTGEKFGSRGK